MGCSSSAQLCRKDFTNLSLHTTTIDVEAADEYPSVCSLRECASGVQRSIAAFTAEERNEPYVGGEELIESRHVNWRVRPQKTRPNQTEEKNFDATIDGASDWIPSENTEFPQKIISKSTSVESCSADGSESTRVESTLASEFERSNTTSTLGNESWNLPKAPCLQRKGVSFHDPGFPRSDLLELSRSNALCRNNRGRSMLMHFK
mmetsp:Transcript_99689/g.157793  ORF Transcript_99689/g.157793 Transcript_99689/m.157793 type:complete len:205 (-) Transcript_99689:483-1097(-)